jgi:hypothetical protein
MKWKFILATAAVLFPVLLLADLPGEGPRLGHDRLTQEAIESGSMTLHDIRSAGLKMFSTPFNKHDGYGDGPMNPADTTAPGGRPTLQGNGTFLRVNGLDGQTCLECHSIISNASIPATLGVGGVGGSVTNAIFQPRLIDVSDDLNLEQAAMDGRFINPLFLFGSGGVELIAQEMTADLQDLKTIAQNNPGTPIALLSKGVHFGELVYDGAQFDLSAVEGIDEDLVVRPFGRKGEFASVRGFDEGAMMFHFGMQPVEKVGVDVDADEDGVSNEVLVGELSALVIFNTTLEPPTEDRRDAMAEQGFDLFTSIGCADCHRPELTSESSILSYRYPEDPLDPAANVYYAVDLARAPAAFPKQKGGGIRVPLYADLKRHDMGPALVADTAPYLHDGRALTLGEAILMHGGEAQAARDQYAALEESGQARILKFLLSLRTPRHPANDLVVRASHK